MLWNAGPLFRVSVVTDTLTEARDGIVGVCLSEHLPNTHHWLLELGNQDCKCERQPNFHPILMLSPTAVRMSIFVNLIQIQWPSWMLPPICQKRPLRICEPVKGNGNIQKLLLDAPKTAQGTARGQMNWFVVPAWSEKNRESNKRKNRECFVEEFIDTNPIFDRLVNADRGPRPGSWIGINSRLQGATMIECCRKEIYRVMG